MPCNSCGNEGVMLCRPCCTALVDRLLEQERQSNGEHGFKPIEWSSTGVDLLQFVLERCGPAVNLLHAAAGRAGDPEDMREAADRLFEASKRLKEAIRSRDIEG